MAEKCIPVDLFNPGQVFACLGFLEAADVLLGDAAGGFDWSGTDARFVLRADGDENPFGAVLAFLAEATVESVAPHGSVLSTQKWNVPTSVSAPGEPFPFPEPNSPATLPALLRTPSGKSILVDHWGDRTQRDNVKFWAGAGGYPGAALFRDGLALCLPLPPQTADDPFRVPAIQSSSFRLDWRRDYIPLDVGFSPNAHGDIEMRGYPIVELMAAIGLTHARPKRFNKLQYGYGVLQGARCDLYEPILHRVALGQTALPLQRRMFRFDLGWPGKEDQARCILDVHEEPTP